MTLSSLINKAEHNISSGANRVVSNAVKHINNAESTIVSDVKSIGRDIESAPGALLHSGKQVIGGIADSVTNEADKLGSAINREVTKIVSAIPDAVEEFGHLGSELEKDLLPSPTAVISETALVVGGFAIIGILVLKFL